MPNVVIYEYQTPNNDTKNRFESPFLNNIVHDSDFVVFVVTIYQESKYLLCSMLLLFTMQPSQ